MILYVQSRKFQHRFTFDIENVETNFQTPPHICPLRWSRSR